MARKQPGLNLSRFTPLFESGSGRRSQEDSRGRPTYKGVTIIKAGLGNSRDRNYYPAETLERSVTEGRFKGLRAYADHPDSVSEEIQPERTIRDMVGIYSNPRFVREGKGGRVVADLHLFRAAKWLSDTVDDLIDMGEADKIGLSINGRGRTVEKSLSLEESADPVDVNYVEEFMTLRSADVVTEAGAGGGFQQLLESAKTKAVKENAPMALTAKQKKAIREATDKGDLAAIQTILTECGCEAPKKAKPVEEAAIKPRKKVAPAVVEDDDAVADADEADDTDAVDPDAELDAAHDDAVAESEEDEGEGDEMDEADDMDEAGDDEDDEDDAVAEADEDDAPVTGNGQHKLSGAAERIRQAAKARTREGAPVVPGGAGVVRHRKAVSGKVRGPGNGQTGFHLKSIHAKQGKGQKGQRFGEANTDRLIEKLQAENARLSSQLRVRTTADRARNLLRESSIPEKMRPEILRLMVGKSEDEMQRVVRYHERLITTAIEEATGYESGGERVEGAGGSRFRESHHGGDHQGDDLSSLLAEAGIPIQE